jgi:hypothetical protein
MKDGLPHHAHLALSPTNEVVGSALAWQAGQREAMDIVSSPTGSHGRFVTEPTRINSARLGRPSRKNL